MTLPEDTSKSVIPKNASTFILNLYCHLMKIRIDFATANKFLPDF